MKKTALITGASRGIGFETALKLSENHGYTVVAVSRNMQKLSELEKIAPAGMVIPCHADIIGQRELIADTLKKNGITHLNLLINNAGYLVKKDFADMKEKDLVDSFMVNAIAPYQLIQQLLPYLEKQAHAHIVNISSMGAVQGIEKFPGLSAYSSSKAALVCITECLALELKDRKISCNCLCLGAVNTEMLAAAFPGYKAGVSAPEMADYIVHFALSAHKVMNGKVIPVSLSTP